MFLELLGSMLIELLGFEFVVEVVKSLNKSAPKPTPAPKATHQNPNETRATSNNIIFFILNKITNIS
jgi:hypothetical protein